MVEADKSRKRKERPAFEAKFEVEEGFVGKNNAVGGLDAIVVVDWECFRYMD